MSKFTSFVTTPLITPERVARDPLEAFSNLPDWATGAVIEYDRVFFTVGKKHSLAIHMPHAEAALCCELGRVGIAIVTNTNGRSGDPLARLYVKFSIPDAPDTNMPIRRPFSGAAEGVATRALEIQSDYSASNVEFTPDARSKWDAREVIIRAARRLAHQQLADGQEVDAYVANLKRWFAEIDRSLEDAPRAAK